MNFTFLQILLLIIIFFALTRVFLRFREKNISVKSAFFWIIVWSLSAIGILLPATTSSLAHLVGVGRGVDVVTYISLFLLFYLTFRIYVMLEEIRRDITSIIRQIAIQNPRKGKSKKKRV
jgi:small membrane protein